MSLSFNESEVGFSDRMKFGEWRGPACLKYRLSLRKFWKGRQEL